MEKVELHGAEVWLTDRGDLVVTVPCDEHDRQSETELRGRLFRAVTHRFGGSDRDTQHAYLQITQTGTLQIIEDNPLFHARPQYGVVLARPGGAT